MNSLCLCKDSCDVWIGYRRGNSSTRSNGRGSSSGCPTGWSSREHKEWVPIFVYRTKQIGIPGVHGVFIYRIDLYLGGEHIGQTSTRIYLGKKLVWMPLNAAIREGYPQHV
jgi:hypothetical protein